MANPTIYSTRDFRLKFAEDSAYRVNPAFLNSSCEITGSNVASLRVNITLTSAQASLAVNFQDVKSCRVLFIDTESSVKVVLNTTASMIIGRTSVVNTVGRPCLYHEGSITAISITNRIPSAPASVRVIGLGVSV